MWFLRVVLTDVVLTYVVFTAWISICSASLNLLNQPWHTQLFIMFLTLRKCALPCACQHPLVCIIVIWYCARICFQLSKACWSVSLLPHAMCLMPMIFRCSCFVPVDGYSHFYIPCPPPTSPPPNYPHSSTRSPITINHLYPHYLSTLYIITHTPIL